MEQNPKEDAKDGQVAWRIRPERPREFPAIYQLIKTAFSTAQMSDGDEQDYAARLRWGDGYLPELSLVAEIDDRCIGHIMLSQTAVVSAEGKTPILLLAPLSVLLPYRNLGVGSALVRTALQQATRLGHGAVVMAGDRHYYARFGFVPASRFGIGHDMDLPPDMQDNIMAQELSPGALRGIQGCVRLT